eukprot:GHVN01098597.1.p1 GENE.GHVN01098597.1~~GHVN01098597.1.p1  ORF type:complete len:497 (+),score=18.90 GHVN01098597.1:65-1555(+)
MQKRLLRKLKRLYRLTHRFPDSPFTYDRYCNHHRVCSLSLRHSRRQFETAVANDTSGFSMAAYVAKVSRSHGPSSIESEGGRVSTPALVAEALASHYQSVSVPPANCCEDVRALPAPTLTELPLMSPETAEALIKRRKAKTGSGPDGIPPILLIKLAGTLSTVVGGILNDSFSSGVIPESWRRSDVTPVFKCKGSRLSPNQYRPISLCCALCLVGERFLFDILTRHLEVNGFLNSQQHGCRWKLSTLTNLLIAFDFALQCRERSPLSILVVLLDFEKAFDKIPHSHLLFKLRRCGVGGKVLRWIKGWLEHRKQRVKVNGSFSLWYSITSGVPQGSVLGPLLFIIYVSDMCDGLESKPLQYADNAKLIHAIKGISDCELLQRDLNRISDWCARWLMKLNTSETHILHVPVSRLSAPPPAVFTFNSVPLSFVSQVRDLGLLYDLRMKFNCHVDVIVGRANAKVDRFKQLFRTRSREIVLRYYLLFVRPIIEYCIPISL